MIRDVPTQRFSQWNAQVAKRDVHLPGNGYASEALGAVIDETFESAELDEIQACIVPENVASRAVLDRTGFREERKLRSGAVIRGRHVDVLLFSLTRASWDRARREHLSRNEKRLQSQRRPPRCRPGACRRANDRDKKEEARSASAPL